jgi:hypothetical protein
MLAGGVEKQFFLNHINGTGKNNQMRTTLHLAGFLFI